MRVHGVELNYAQGELYRFSIISFQDVVSYAYGTVTHGAARGADHSLSQRGSRPQV
jgi:hypothetical protein